MVDRFFYFGLVGVRWGRVNGGCGIEGQGGQDLDFRIGGVK